MKIPTYILSLVLLTFISSSVFGQVTSKTIFLVRHAEKGEDLAGDRNPPLNEKGALRAQKLAQILIEADIEYIYSTDFKRTTDTGVPLAKALEMDIMKYDSRKPEALSEILSETGSERILIIGHSNTIPKMVNELIGKKKYNLNDDEYDKLFIVSLFGEDSDCVVLTF